MTKHMRKRMKRALILCAASVCLAATAQTALAAPYQLGRVPTRERSSYSTVPIKEEGTYLDMDARLIDGTTYVPLRAFCEAMGWADISFRASDRTAIVRATGLTIEITDGSHCMVANGRYIYHTHPAVILDDDRFYVPVRMLEKAYGVKIVWDDRTRSVTVEGEVTPILHGDLFYNADDVYWLSKIISAEARGESLLGQIAVGNVVLNRVRSSAYPNSVYGVIFDRKYGVQFSPVSNGSIYLPAAESSVIAAKICLDGFTVSPRALFFYEPNLAHSHWIAQNREYLFTIGHHRFYA